MNDEYQTRQFFDFQLSDYHNCDEVIINSYLAKRIDGTKNIYRIDITQPQIKKELKNKNI